MQTSKTVTDSASSVLSVTTFSYDLRGRLIEVASTEGSTITQTQYAYDSSGVRVKQTVTVDGGTPVVTEYLIDARNLTGYAKAIRELVDSVVARDYTIGHQIISQQDGTGTPVFYVHDGHGSTRVLTILAGGVATNSATPQVFHYTAFGDAHGFDAAAALTTWQFGGDGQRDPSTGLVNHLARWRSGFIFLGLDPFFGNLRDPQSFHKHLYAHGDPRNGKDPTGRSLIIGALSGLAANLNFQSLHSLAVVSFGASVAAGLIAGFHYGVKYGEQLKQQRNLKHLRMRTVAMEFSCCSPPLLL